MNRYAWQALERAVTRRILSMTKTRKESLAKVLLLVGNVCAEQIRATVKQSASCVVAG